MTAQAKRERIGGNVQLAVGKLAVKEYDGDAIGRGSLFVSFLIRVVSLNVLLAVFNMLPVPMLDGGNVLAGLLKGQVAQLYDNLRPYGFLILYALLLTGVFATVVTPIYTVVLGWLL